MAISPALRRLRDITASALETLERDLSISPDRHAPTCDCCHCELARAARELVAAVDELDTGRPSVYRTLCPNCAPTGVEVLTIGIQEGWCDNCGAKGSTPWLGLYRKGSTVSG